MEVKEGRRWRLWRCDSRRRVKVCVAVVHHPHVPSPRAHLSVPVVFLDAQLEEHEPLQKPTKRESTEPRWNRCELKLSCLAAANVRMVSSDLQINNLQRLSAGSLHPLG